MQLKTIYAFFIWLGIISIDKKLFSPIMDFGSVSVWGGAEGGRVDPLTKESL